MLLLDYHTHTKLCKHATGELNEYIEYAIQLGLNEIGCSEHIPMPDGFDAAHRMSLGEFTGVYTQAFLAAKKKYSDRIDVKWGIEAEYFPGTEKYVGDFIEAHGFDYVIGSVHFLGEWGFDNPTDVWRYDVRDIDDIYREYFAALADSARSGLFDVVGHCDLVKKFGHRPSHDMTPAYRDALRAIRKADMCIEINTSGLRKPARELYPGREILAMAKELGIPLTLGSDAHQPDDVGRDFDVAYPLLKEFGNGEIATFTKRKRTMVRLNENHSRLNP